MPNLHAHAVRRAMAGLAEVAGNPNDSFWTWRDLMYRLDGKISPDQLGIIARQLYIEMLKAGYTPVAEFHYVHHDSERSEEHSSELQSLMRTSSAVCCLKKKKHHALTPSTRINPLNPTPHVTSHEQHQQ